MADNALGALFTEQADAIREGLGDIGKISPLDTPNRIREIVALIGTGGGTGDSGEATSELNIKTGTFTATPSTRIAIEHGLGEMPDLVMVYFANVSSALYADANNYPIMSVIGMKGEFGFGGKCVTAGWTMQTSYGIDNVNLASSNNYIYCPNDSTFQVGNALTDNVNFQLADGEKYNWLAISGMGGAASGGSSDDVRYVTFMNGDVEIGKKPVAVGDDCRYIFDTPTKASTAQYNYTFYGWGASDGGGADANILKNITEDKTVYAIFTATVRYYTITYYDDDGTTVLKTESLAYGATPSYEPTKDGAAFTGWSPAVATVTGNASYTASWVEVIGGSISDTATWMLEDGVLTISGSGEMPTYTAASDVPWYEYREAITSLVVEDGITMIRSDTFNDLSNMKTASIANSVTSIGNSSFSGCGSLESMSIPFVGISYYSPSASSVTHYPFGYIFGTTSYAGGVLTEQKSVSGTQSTIRNVYIPSSLKSVSVTGDGYLPSYSFVNCSNITDITIASGPKYIQSYSFQNCTGLTSVTLPDTAISIGSNAFEGCTGLTSVTLPDAVTSINSSAFYGCTGLTDITIPDTVTQIGGNAFNNCSNLFKVTFGDNSSLTKIGEKAFAQCKKLDWFQIKENVTTIYPYAFQGCSALRGVGFYDREGWFVASSATATSGTTIDVYDNVDNKNKLTNTYVSKYFRDLT